MYSQDVEMDLDMEEDTGGSAATSSYSHRQQQQSRPKQEALPSISNLFDLASQSEKESIQSARDSAASQVYFHRVEPSQLRSIAGFPPPLSVGLDGQPLSSPPPLLMRSISSSSSTASSSSPMSTLRNLEDDASSPSSFGPIRGSAPLRSLYSSSSSSASSPATYTSEFPVGAPSPCSTISSSAMSPRTTPRPPRLALHSSSTAAFSIEDEMEYEKEESSSRSSMELSNQSSPSFTFPQRAPFLSECNRSVSSNAADLPAPLHRNPSCMLPPPTIVVGSARSAGAKVESSWGRHQRSGTDDGIMGSGGAAGRSTSSTASSSQQAQDRRRSEGRRHTLGAADAPRSGPSSRLSNLNPGSSLGAELAQTYRSALSKNQVPPVPSIPSLNLKDAPPASRFFPVQHSHSSPSIPTVSHHHPYQVANSFAHSTSHARTISNQSRSSSGTGSGRESYHSSRGSQSSSRDSYVSSKDSSYLSNVRDSGTHLSINSGLSYSDQGRELPESPTTPTGPSSHETPSARSSQYGSSSDYIPRHSNRASTSTMASSTSSLPSSHFHRSLPSLVSSVSGSASASSLSLSLESRSNHSRNSTIDSVASSGWNQPQSQHPHHLDVGMKDGDDWTRGADEEMELENEFPSQPEVTSSSRKSGKSKSRKPRLPPRISSLKLREEAAEWESGNRGGGGGIEYETEGSYQDDSPELGSGGSNNGGITPSQSRQALSNQPYWSPDSPESLPSRLEREGQRQRHCSDGSGSGSSSGSFSKQSFNSSSLSKSSRLAPASSPSHQPLPGPGFFLPQRTSSMDLDEAYGRGIPSSNNGGSPHLSQSSNQGLPSLRRLPPNSAMGNSSSSNQFGSKSSNRISAGSLASSLSGSSSGSFHSIYCQGPPAESVASLSSITSGDGFDSTDTFGKPNLTRTKESAPSASSVGKGNQDSTSSSTPSAGGTGKYECSYCQKRFTRPSSLKIHTHTHTGEKPYVCPDPTCGRSFSVQSNLRRHQKAHGAWQQRAEDNSIPENEPVKSNDSISSSSNLGSSPLSSSFAHGNGHQEEEEGSSTTDSSSSGMGRKRASSSSSNFSTGIRERFEGMMTE